MSLFTYGQAHFWQKLSSFVFVDLPISKEYLEDRNGCRAYLESSVPKSTISLMEVPSCEKSKIKFIITFKKQILDDVC